MVGTYCFVRRVYRLVHRYRFGAVAAAALVVAGCTSAGHLGPPQSPKVVVHLTIDGKQYTGTEGTQLTGRRPLILRSGRRVAIALSLTPQASDRVSDVFLGVNGYPVSIGDGHSNGKYQSLIRHKGALPVGEQLKASWTASRLFNTNMLDLTLSYTVRDAGASWPVAHLRIIRIRGG